MSMLSWTFNEVQQFYWGTVVVYVHIVVHIVHVHIVNIVMCNKRSVGLKLNFGKVEIYSYHPQWSGLNRTQPSVISMYFIKYLYLRLFITYTYTFRPMLHPPSHQTVPNLFSFLHTKIRSFFTLVSRMGGNRFHYHLLLQLVCTYCTLIPHLCFVKSG